MQDIRQRLRSIRRTTRAAQLFSALWSFVEVVFVSLGVSTGDKDMAISHGFAFAVAFLMMIVMATAARVFQENLLEIAVRARARGGLMGKTDVF